MEDDKNNKGELILFQAKDGQAKVQVRFEDKNVWLTQATMAELFQTTPQNITLHLKSIYEEGELLEEATCKEYLQVRQEGKREIKRQLKHYSLEAIIAVGYRVKSRRGTQFRQWATSQLHEFLQKGFIMDDERLKSGKNIGDDYFDELIARIRDIRSSERRFYQKITDIYSTSIDYDSKSEMTFEFYKTVQNKLHWAIHGQTAAEVVVARADASKANMGLTSWKNSPDGPIRKTDISVAKNYLLEEELTALNRIVVMYLDYAENQAAKRIPMHMADWIQKLDGFLQFNGENILTHAGKISHQMAIDHASSEFEKYETNRRALEASEPTGDFDAFVQQLLTSNQKKD
jgi:hypothetical protein